MADQPSPVYIGIPDHSEIRRNLLLCSRDIIGALKAYEACREARTQRIELAFDLHKTMDELAVLTKKIRLKLPKMPAKRDMGGLMQEPAPPALSKKGKGKGAAQGSNKLSVLDKEMTRIEQRIKKLS